MFLKNLPSSVLSSIVAGVLRELQAWQSREPLSELQAKVKSAAPTRDFHAALSSGFGLIAEIKRKSPSLGAMLNQDVESIARAYAESPVVKAVSVLTNLGDFGMDVPELGRVRALVPQPILRKDFIFDPYQVWQARAYGADAILLMANVVTREGLRELSQLAESLGMHVLFETHEASEIQELPQGAKICGINSRRFMAGKGKSTRGAYLVSSLLSRLGIRLDLSIDRSHFDLARLLPEGCVKVAESGVDPSMIGKLRTDFHSALVGTSILMSKRGVQLALKRFEKEIASPQLALQLELDRNGLQRAAA